MESKEGVEALFLYATEGILVVNDKGEITRANPSTEKLFGYEENELIGKKIEILVPKRLTSRHENHREKYHENPHARAMGAEMELFGLKKDGSEFPVEISLSPYTVNEGKFVIAFIHDITQRKLEDERMKQHSGELEKQVKNRTLVLEEAILELEKTKLELNKALEKEKELSELKSRFVSMASHEFRTPLTTMMSSISLVKKYSEQDDRENQSKHISKIKNSIHNLTYILNDFLSVSRLEEGKIECLPEKMNLRTFLLEIVSDMNSMAKTGQSVILEYKGNDIVFLDPKLLKNVLLNLISNAIKFSPENKKIEVKAEALSCGITISIKDEGIGISLKDQKHLFERFFRGQNATHIQGTGLGLNIVTNYIELMKGSLHFESEEDKGTCFIISFPQ